MRVSHLHQIAASSQLEVHEPRLVTRLVARATGSEASRGCRRGDVIPR